MVQLGDGYPRLRKALPDIGGCAQTPLGDTIRVGLEMSKGTYRQAQSDVNVL
jgi:hypothetical protein